MASRKKRTIIEETLPEGTTGTNTGEENLSEFDVALESVEDIEALRTVIEQFGETGALLKIYRQTSSGNEFCYQTDSLDEEFIQKNFGGGDYQVRVFINGKYRKTMKLKIAGRIATPENGNGNGSHPDRHSEFLEKIVIAMLAGDRQNNGPSITELTTALSNLDGLRGKQESAMDLFQKGVTFAREIMDMKPSGSGDWKSELVSAAKDAIPMLGNLIPGARKPNPVAGEQPSQITEPTPEQQTEMIKQGLAYLKRQCLKNVDPELIIEWVVNNAEDYQPLIHMVLNVPFEKFVEIDAEIGNEPFKQWFTGLFNGLRSSFVPADTVGVDSTGNDGDSVDAGNHGKPSTGSKPKGK